MFSSTTIMTCLSASIRAKRLITLLSLLSIRLNRWLLISFVQFVGKRIVGFQVSPRSIEHNLEDENDLDKLCQDGEPQRVRQRVSKQ